MRRVRLLAPGWHLQFCADVDGDLGGIVVHEMADPVMRNAAELRPFPQRADRGLLACREYTAQAKADNISQLILRGGM